MRPMLQATIKDTRKPGTDTKTVRFCRFPPAEPSGRGTLNGMMPKQRPQKKSVKIRVLLSVPLTPEQKRELARRAGVRPLSAYARDVLFPANDNAPPRRVRRCKDREALAAAALAQLGKSEAAAALREIARGVRLGIIILTPETDAALREAANTVQKAAQAAMRALGVKPR